MTDSFQAFRHRSRIEVEHETDAEVPEAEVGEELLGAEASKFEFSREWFDGAYVPM